MKIISYKKIILILMCMSMLSLLGCTNNKILKSNKNQVSNKVHKINNKSSNFLGCPIYLDPRAGEVAYSTITEEDYFIYYCSENGINRVDKKTGEYKLILKCKNTGNLILSDRYIFLL